MLRKTVDSTLRGRGSLPRSAGTLCFEDNTSLHGGPYVWRSILSEVVHCLSTTALEVEHLIILNLDSSPEEISDVLSALPQRCQRTVLDGFSDPEGWFGKAMIPQTASHSQCINLKSIDDVARIVYDSLATRSLVMIDALSTLIFRHDPSSVLQMLNKLVLHHNCCCLVIRYRTEGRNSDEIEAVRSFCTGRFQLTQPSKILLSLSETTPHGAIISFQTTETGRIVTHEEWYRIDRLGHISFFPAPDALHLDSTKLVEATIKCPTAEHHGNEEEGLEKTLMRQMEGGMRLTLTKEEKDAKKNVILPYEDVSSLGEIHYVRDSEEDYDSDEDPDDDLDI